MRGLGDKARIDHLHTEFHRQYQGHSALHQLTAPSPAARRKFSPEFMNRIDKVIVFRTLVHEHLERILNIELGRVQERIISATGSS